MQHKLERPTNPYDPAWIEYARQNPGLRRSLSAADPVDPAPADPADPPAAPDFSFVPENFIADGKPDTAAFRTSYDELASFKAQMDEAKAALPAEPTGYEFKVGEGHALPEGFDPDLFKDVDADGNEVLFDVNKMINPDDPDLPLLQAALHKHGADPALMGELAGILANRELRGVMSATEAAATEKTALGPQGQSRIDTLSRTIDARLPKEQAAAVKDLLTSADAVRGLETLFKNSSKPVVPVPPGGVDMDNMSSKELIALGISQRSKP